MNIKYNRIFGLKLAHEFYKDGVNKDIQLFPSSNTKQLLSNGKMLFKSLGNSLFVSYKTDIDKTSPFINLGKDVSFRFYIVANRTDDFFNTTKLDTVKKYKAGNKLYFTNIPANASTENHNPEVLQHSLIDKAFGKLFTYSFSLTTTHTKAKIILSDQNGNLISVGKDSDGNDLPTTLNIRKDEQGIFHQSIDVRNKPSGYYTITVKNDANTTTLKEESVWLDNDAVHQNVLGIVDIIYNTATNHLYGATEFYKILFQRKTTYWKYYVVNKSNNIDLADLATSLSIEDSASGGGSPYINVNFPREGAEPNVTKKVKGFDTVVFKSDATIPVYENPKLNIKLLLKPSNKVVVDHLPNPPLNAVEKENGGDIEKEIFVFI